MILPTAMFVFIFESNLGFESQHLLHAVESDSSIKNWVAMSEGASSGLGWLTTNERKETMVLLTREAMRVGKIAFSQRFFSTSMTIKESRNRILDELGNFCVVKEPPKTTFGKMRITYTGKLHGHQDDVCIALMLAIIGSSYFFQNEKYQKWHNPGV
jgi:hypothetical protein